MSSTLALTRRSRSLEFMKEHPEHLAPGNAMKWLSEDGGETYNLLHFWSNFVRRPVSTRSAFTNTLLVTRRKSPPSPCGARKHIGTTLMRSTSQEASSSNVGYALITLLSLPTRHLRPSRPLTGLGPAQLAYLR